MNIQVFPDTNILMHFQPIANIDWLNLTGATSVEIVIPAEVIKELENHKISPNPRRQKKAKAVLSMLRKIYDDQGIVRPDVSLRISTHLAPKEKFALYSLDSENSDDRIIIEVLLFTKQTSGTVIFVTDDFGAKIKAEQNNLKVLELPEDLALPPEPDPSVAAINELQKKIRSLETKSTYLPELSLEFENTKSVVSFELKPEHPLSQDELNNLVQKGEALCPVYVPPRSALKLVGKSYLESSRILEPPPDREIERFERERDSYLDSYSKYIRSYDKIRTMLSLSFDIDIFLRNSGKSPAKGVRIWMHFPDGFTMPEKRMKLPKEPVVPRPPMNQWDEMRHSAMKRPVIDLPMLYPSGHKSNVSSPRISKTNSYEVKQHVEELLHTQRCKLSTFQICFDSKNEVKPFQIEYELIAENTPEPFKGVINVIVK